MKLIDLNLAQNQESRTLGMITTLAMLRISIDTPTYYNVDW